MKLPQEVREQFVAYGRTGGKTRARRLPKARRTAIARLAAVGRWTRARFGAASFAELGLPGGELVDAGLADLAGEHPTVPALTLLVAASRLRREGVPLPGMIRENPERELFRALERRNPTLAHARYLAHVEEISSFADALRRRRLLRSGDDRAA